MAMKEGPIDGSEEELLDKGYFEEGFPGDDFEGFNVEDGEQIEKPDEEVAVHGEGLHIGIWILVEAHQPQVACRHQHEPNMVNNFNSHLNN